MTIELKNAKSESGFTLVELAIVMIIVGMLIGGILKGQELIQNTRISTTVTQAKAIDAATNTFRDMYKAIPGDMMNPAVRLRNCGAATFCGLGGPDGNSVLDLAPGVAHTATSENAVFFSQLAAADLLGGVNPTGTAIFGSALPNAEIGGGFRVGTHNGGTFTVGNGPGSPGMYLALTNLPLAIHTATTGTFLSPAQASRIDLKIDDGIANAGGVIPFGTFGAAGSDSCAITHALGTASLYLEAEDNVLCGLYIRIQ